MNKVIIRPTFDDNDDDEEESESKEKEKYLPYLKIQYRIKETDGDEFIESFIDNGFITMLKKIFTVISSQTGSTKINIVSSVPFYYTTSQIMYYKSLLLQSGFNPLQIIYDHSASILSLHLDNNPNIKSVLCIDFGTFHSTFCVIQMCNGLVTSNTKQNYYHQTSEVCGVVMDECILKWLIKDFQNRNRGCYIEPENAKCRLKLCKEIARIKSVLSSGSGQVRVDIESLYEGIDYHFNLSKAKFESIIYDVLSAITNWVHQQIKYCQEQMKLSFDKVIVSGGLAEIPKLKNSLQQMFGEKLGTKELVSKGIAANFVNAYGCAVQAASLSYLYTLQNQIQSGPQALHKIVNINKQQQNNQKRQSKNAQRVVYKEKNVILNKFTNNRIAFSAKRCNLYCVVGKERKLLCCIGKLSPLPFESEYTFEEGDVGGVDEVVFVVDVIGDDEKTVLDTVEQSMNGNCLQIKKKKKNLLVNITMDATNEIVVSVGKEKVVFEFDEEEDNDNESGEEDVEEVKTNDIDAGTIDID